ncbi:MAG: bifunctional folylpolyglutamate synthase/dihydrofolate synthase [Runella sp.]
MMTYPQALDYLYARLPAFHRVGRAAMKPGLENIKSLCEALDNPHQKFKSVHIAGTNGKGSTSHMLAAILQSAGYKVGLHTSPHLKSLTERFKINGQSAPESVVVDFVEKHKSLIEKISPSFFEITVAIAFDYFAQAQVDIAVIEVGLGGRLDSTNIITPEVSVITNIGYDHTDLLGDTLPEIAFEKAGIIKSRVPVVISEFQSETMGVFAKRAYELQSPVYIASQDTHVTRWQCTPEGLLFDLLDDINNRAIKNLKLDLLGQYQLKNVVGVYQTVEVLGHQGFKINNRAFRDGLARCTSLTQLKGRWQIIRQNPTVVADVAHNVEGLTETMAQLQRQSYRRLHLVLGFVKDKDVAKVLSILPREAQFYFCSFNLPRAIEVGVLFDLVAQAGIEGEFYRDVNEALADALANSQPDDLIYVGGSTFVVAELREV